MNLLVEKHVMVPMPDGIRLATDVYREVGAPPRPALLARLPYGKDALQILATPVLPDLFRLAEAGYVVVVQDARGTGRSEGVFEPMVNEGADGATTLSWVSAQPWCDGRVAMFGASYLGFTQWLATRTSSVELVAIAPALTTSNHHRAPWYHDGVLELGTTLAWSLSMALTGAHRQRSDGHQVPRDLVAALEAAVFDPPPLERRLPLTDQPLLERHAPWYTQWLGHPEYDGFWRSLSQRESYQTVTVPALHIAGWYDIFLGSTLDSYVGMRRHGGNEQARRGQRLLVGPWAHADQTGVYADRSFGPAANLAAQDITARHLDFFDSVLRGKPASAHPVRIFVMGIDQWRDEDDWPLPDAEYVDYFLSSSGRANTAAGDGTLARNPPLASGEDIFRYDPSKPVPTVGGIMIGLTPGHPAGPADQFAVEQRDDVLCYSTPQLARALEVTGPVELVVFLSSSGRDTDVTAKLVDVHPDGRALNLTDGVLRARYRDSTSEPELLEPSRIYELRIDLWATSNAFLPGHRIRVEVSSSNFPRFDRNTNTGGVIATAEESDFVPVLNRVHYGPDHPSRLILPIIDRT